MDRVALHMDAPLLILLDREPFCLGSGIVDRGNAGERKSGIADLLYTVGDHDDGQIVALVEREIINVRYGIGDDDRR